MRCCLGGLAGGGRWEIRRPGGTYTPGGDNQIGRAVGVRCSMPTQNYRSFCLVERHPNYPTFARI
jgi:hypothetical protein